MKKFPYSSNNHLISHIQIYFQFFFVLNYKDIFTIDILLIMGDRFLKAGNPALFFLIRILNILFALTGLGLIALSIWLWTQFRSFTILEIVFMGLGVFQFLLVLLIFTARKSVMRLRCFLFVTFILFVVEIICVIVVFATGDGIIKRIAGDSSQQVDKLKDYLNVITFYTLGHLAIIVLQMIFTYCYIGSLRNRNQDYDYKKVDSQGNKITVRQQIQHDKAEINQKYSKKRQQLAQKYNNYRAHEGN